MMHMPFTRTERQELLDSYFPAYRQWQDLDYQLAVDTKNTPADSGRELDELSRTLSDLRSRYLAGLPFLPVSRCPFSGMVVYHSLDPFGIDGLWWNYEAAVRPVENLPVTVHAVTGALRISGPVVPTPFLCMPGPGAPYVLPAILSYDRITAVISSVPVGTDTGYMVVYFSAGVPARAPRADSWGMNHWEMLTDDRTFAWGEGLHGARGADFDLLPWIEREKLLWIPPGDPTVSLQAGTAGCPFLRLDGTRALQRIRNGRVYLEETEE